MENEYEAQIAKQKKLIDDLILENLRLSNRDKILVAEKVAAVNLMKRWRIVVGISIAGFWFLLYTPHVVRAFLGL